MKRYLYTVLFALAYILMGSTAASDSVPDTMQTVAPPVVKPVMGKQIVYTFKLDEDIMPSAERLVRRALEEADSMKADYFVMELNTYGGRVDIADNIRKLLLNARPTTVVWVNKNAASAGALISIACDSIYMSEGASMGAATVVSGEDGQRMPDKYQSYMRSTMRATAEAKGRDPKIAEAMVDDRSKIEGVVDSGYTLSLTPSEAIKLNFCEGQAGSLEEVITELGISNYDLKKYDGNLLESIISFLLNPIVSSLLLLMIIGGLMYEMKTPGIGFPLAVAVTASVLYFFPLYIDGLAENWEILLFIGGLVLLGLEIFVIPGFGVAGISGIILVVGGLTLALLNNINLDFSYTSVGDVSAAFFRVVISMAFMLGLFLFLSEKIFHTPLFQKLALTHTQNASEGYTSTTPSLNALVGRRGIALTDLRPSGKVELEDERYEAVAEGPMVVKGSAIKVLRVQGNYVVVKQVAG